MPRFFPPVHRDGPKYAPDEAPSMKRLLSFYKPFPPTGYNVWVLKDEFVIEPFKKVSTAQPPVDEWIEFYYGGARWHTISDAEAAVLRAAGMEVLDDVVVAGGYAGGYAEGY